MATLSVVRYALVSQLIDQLGSGVSVEAVPPETVTGTTVVVGGMNTEVDVLGGWRKTEVPLWVVVSRKHRSFIEELDRLCDTGTGGVHAALDADPTLGGVVDSSVVTGTGNYRDMMIADVSHYAATVDVEVFH